MNSEDEYDNIGYCNFTVSVTDDTPPQVVCPDDIVTEAIGPGGAVVSFPVLSSIDPNDGLLTTMSSIPSGSEFPLGTTLVTLSSVDPSSNIGLCAFHVTVRDETPPSFVCPINVTLEAVNNSGAFFQLPFVSTVDIVDGLNSDPVRFNATSGYFTLGATHVLVQATDTANNNRSCVFVVLVQDTTPPLLQCPSQQLIFSATSAGVVRKTFRQLGVSTSDLIDPSPVVSISLQLLNELPTVSVGSAYFQAGIIAVNLTSTDFSGNPTTCTFSVLAVPYGWCVSSAADGNGIDSYSLCPQSTGTFKCLTSLTVTSPLPVTLNYCQCNYGFDGGGASDCVCPTQKNEVAEFFSASTGSACLDPNLLMLTCLAQNECLSNRGCPRGKSCLIDGNSNGVGVCE